MSNFTTINTIIASKSFPPLLLHTGRTVRVVIYFDKHKYLLRYLCIVIFVLIFFRTCIFLNFCEVLLTQIWKTRKSIYYVFIAGLQKVYCTLLFQLWQKLHPSKKYKWKPEFLGCFFFGFFSRFFFYFFLIQ